MAKVTGLGGVFIKSRDGVAPNAESGAQPILHTIDSTCCGL